MQNGKIFYFIRKIINKFFPLEKLSIMKVIQIKRRFMSFWHGLETA